MSEKKTWTNVEMFAHVFEGVTVQTFHLDEKESFVSHVEPRGFENLMIISNGFDDNRMFLK